MKTFTKKQLQAIETRQKLLDAGRICFLQHGFQKCTMKDIIQQAKVGYGTAYVYFSNKDDLFIELMDFIMEDLVAIAHWPFEPATADEAFQAIQAQTRAFLTKGLERRAFFQCIEEALRLSAAVRAKWRIVQQAFIQQIERDILYVQQKKLATKAVHPTVAATSWYMLNETMLWQLLATTAFHLEDVVNTLVTMYVTGLYL